MSNVTLPLTSQGILPKAGTQNRQVLTMLSYGPVCPKDVGFTSRLAARIYDLKALGWPITKNNVCRRHRHVSRVAEYRLEPK